MTTVTTYYYNTFTIINIHFNIYFTATSGWNDEGYSTESLFNTSFSTEDDSSSSTSVDLSGIINGVAGTFMTVFTFCAQCMVFVVVSKDPRLRTPGKTNQTS